MNKYEELFAGILKQTKSGVLHWKQVRRQSNSDLIFNPNIVFRQFTADFYRGDNKFKLLLVEKKYEDPEEDFLYEKYILELLVIDHDGELVVTLTDSIIERAEMIRLADMAETRSDKAAKLFNSKT